MPERVIPPGLIWPSRAAETFRRLSFKHEALPQHEPGFKNQYGLARTQLVEALATDRILSAFLVSSEGIPRPLPGRFWYTGQQDFAWHGDYLTLLSEPMQQFWPIDESGYPTGGFALVNEASLLRFLADGIQALPDGLDPEPREKKSAYVIRALGLREARSITTEETRPIAERWLRANQLPCGKTEIDDEIKRMKASMRDQRRKP
jgi:hypothetical protein